LAVAELAFVAGVEASVERLGGVEYLVFEGAVPHLSSTHAAFEVVGDLLRPVEVPARAVCDDDLLTIQRYAGKTNEQFTALLVNVTAAAATGDVRRLLDPLCGRGTTLNQAVVWGLDAAGVEVDRRDVDAYRTFFLTWLKDKRVKHRSSVVGRRFSVVYGPSKRTVEVVAADTVDAGAHLRTRSFDVVVADLPYGVQHGSRSAGTGLRRSPEELLVEALPVWHRMLRPGGAMGLAWNRRTLDRGRLVELVEAAGLRPERRVGDDAFVHRVDRSITRDLLVATRPSA
jgi:tRNA G10  N-methylase Trm11